MAIQKKYQLSEGILFSIVSRAAAQKGLHLVAEEIDALVANGCCFVFLANGDPQIMAMLKTCENKHPMAVRVIPEFDPKVARLLYGGSDFIVVPSLYEPCGLTQMMAMRYGAVPVVRRTGGLADTVKHQATGVTFDAISSNACKNAIIDAAGLFHDAERYAEIQRACMKTDYSWDRARAAYDELYRKIVDTHTG